MIFWPWASGCRLYKVSDLNGFDEKVVLDILFKYSHKIKAFSSSFQDHLNIFAQALL